MKNEKTIAAGNERGELTNESETMKLVESVIVGWCELFAKDYPANRETVYQDFYF